MRIFILGFLFICACGQVEDKQRLTLISDSNKVIQTVDTTNYAIIKSDSSVSSISKKSNSVELNSEDIKDIEILLTDCIKKYNLDELKKFNKMNKEHPEAKLDKYNFIIGLSKYKRQYIAEINARGEKEVWINCFCEVFGDWKKEIVMVEDGGNCFFNLKINLTKKTYFDLSVNGDA